MALPREIAVSACAVKIDQIGRQNWFWPPHQNQFWRINFENRAPKIETGIQKNQNQFWKLKPG
jgi:hypothetical protein